MIEKLARYLEENNVTYTIIYHSTRFTTQEIAAGAAIPGLYIVKSVMIRMDGELAMVVLPASSMARYELLKPPLGADHIEPAKRRDFMDLFPECEIGAIPPFGNLAGIRVYADVDLARHREIAFSGGDFSELVRIRFDDYERLVDPVLVDVSGLEKRTGKSVERSGV
ncbi:MAG: aminoacyl-tRNA deacylase [Desulfovibrionales bacterium]